MLHEVANALFVTYVATEYLVKLDSLGCSPWRELSASKPVRAGGCLVVFVNMCTHVHFHLRGAAVVSAAGGALKFVSHLPRVSFAAIAYVLALFFDCRRSQPTITVWDLLRKVGSAFCRIAPIYPFLAVMISFVFLFVISFFEAFHLPLKWLNMPIYYGTLYGPFSAIYWNVKRRVVESSEMLPTTAQLSSATTDHRKGSACLHAATRRSNSALSG